MSDLESLERRMDQIERKLDDAMKQRAVGDAAGEPEQRGHRHSGSVRVLIGVLIIVMGLLWLGKDFGLEWLDRVEFWAFALIGVGVVIIFGEGRR